VSERIEGRNAVVEALRSGDRVERVLIAVGVDRSDILQEIERRAREAGVPVDMVPRHELDRMSVRGSHQGVIAQTRPFRFVPVESILRAGQASVASLVVALDHVTDPGNLGAVARSAEAVGATGLVLPKDRSAAVTAATHKASAGALEHLPVAQVPNLVRSLDLFKQAGYWVAGADQDAQDDAWDIDLDAHLVLVAGSEGSGLARLTKRSCDVLVRMPVMGQVGSLNVAQAVTALSYEWLRQHRP
jgi:23S rRNA (guanosine2251-2'-O)-methyltransferase